MYDLEAPVGNKPLSGGGAQILGHKDEELCTFPDVKGFWPSHGMNGLCLFLRL